MSGKYSDDLVVTLEFEWAGISSNRAVDIVAWERPLAAMRNEFDEIRRAGRWQRGPSDFFGVLGLSRREVAHCSMLAWLLDPDGRHGLGRSFLDSLIEAALPDLEPTELRVRSVDTEVQRFETRADIVVWGDSATLIIEAKVDAGEGWHQCDRLFDRFSEEPGSRFLFLTPAGHKPLTATGPAEDAFVVVSFRQIADCLESALQRPSGSAVDRNGVVHNYLHTLRSQFS